MGFRTILRLRSTIRLDDDSRWNYEEHVSTDLLEEPRHLTWSRDQFDRNLAIDLVNKGIFYRIRQVGPRKAALGESGFFEDDGPWLDERLFPPPRALSTKSGAEMLDEIMRLLSTPRADLVASEEEA